MDDGGGNFGLKIPWGDLPFSSEGRGGGGSFVLKMSCDDEPFPLF